MKIRIRPETAALIPFFLAGIFFIVTGFAAVVFPRFFAIALAGAFVLLGAGLCIAGVMFIRLRNRLSALAKQMQATVQIQKLEIIDEDADSEDRLYH